MYDEEILNRMLLRGENTDLYEAFTRNTSAGYDAEKVGTTVVTVMNKKRAYFRKHPEHLYFVSLVICHPEIIETLACYTNNTMLEY